MKLNIAPALIALTLVLPAVTPAQDATMPGIIPYEVHVQTLDNGLKVIVMPMEGTELVSYWSIARVGSPGRGGGGAQRLRALFRAHDVRGTENFPAARYNEMLTTMGANGNAFTTDDLTGYHVTIVAEDLEQLAELESDRFRYLSYAEPEFETEAGAVYGEYRKNRTNPLYTLYEAMAGTAFHEHPYGHMVIGYEDDIAAMPSMYDYSRDFFSRFYRPDNVVLFIVGGVTPDSVMPWSRSTTATGSRATCRPRYPWSRRRRRSGAWRSPTTDARCPTSGWPTSSTPSIRRIPAGRPRTCS